jgi:hypothetical protein
VVGKSLGILLESALAVSTRLALKQTVYMGPTRRSGRAWRYRLHDVAVRRRWGVPVRGRFRGR